MDNVLKQSKTLFSQLVRKLRFPIVATFFSIAVLSGVLLLKTFQERLDETEKGKVKEIESEFYKIINEQARGLMITLHLIATDSRTRMGIRNRDREQLLSTWSPVFETFHKEQGITHFPISDSGQVRILRIHKPEFYGDRYDQFIIREAKRTGKPIAGLEFGVLGHFTLRVAEPVFEGNTRIGFVELGKEIEDVLTTIKASRPDVELSVVFRKSSIQKNRWEEGMLDFGRDPHWDLLSNSVISYSSLKNYPKELLAIADHDSLDWHDHNASHHSTWNGKDWNFTAVPLKDASGKEVGDLLIMNDVSNLRKEFQRSLLLSGLNGAIALSLLSILLYIIFRRIEQQIQIQQVFKDNANAELLHQAGLIKSLLDNIPDLIFYKDINGIYIGCNPIFAELVGKKSPDEVIGNTDYDLFSKELADFFRYHDLEMLKQLSPRHNEEEVSFPDGKVMLIDTLKMPYRDQNGEVIGILGISRDITERKKAENALKESEERFKALHNASFGGIAIHEKGIILECNQGLSEMTGYAKDEIIGMNGLLLIAPEFRDMVLNKIATGYEKSYEAFGLRKNGEQFPMRLEARNVPYKGKDVRTVEFRDLTENKQKEEAVKEANRKLIEKNKELEQLLNIASHDLRTPLVNVVGFSGELENSFRTLNALLASTHDPNLIAQALQTEFPDIEESIGRIRASTAQMNNLLKALLMLGRTGRAALQIENLDIDQLLERLAPSFSYRIKEAGIRLNIQKLPDCQGDAVQVTQVFSNLIDNAIKYHDKDRPGQITVSGSICGLQAVYRVEDNGIGIATEHQEKIFELFYRLKPRETEGEGIGLTMVRQILQRMGGEISVESILGDGCVFIVSLPAQSNLSTNPISCNGNA